MSWLQRRQSRLLSSPSADASQGKGNNMAKRRVRALCSRPRRRPRSPFKATRWRIQCVRVSVCVPVWNFRESDRSTQNEKNNRPWAESTRQGRRRRVVAVVVAVVVVGGGGGGGGGRGGGGGGGGLRVPTPKRCRSGTSRGARRHRTGQTFDGVRFDGGAERRRPRQRWHRPAVAHSQRNSQRSAIRP